MKKPKETVMDRPLTLKSGVALQSNYSVHHRSDILMEEQIDAVKKGQEELKAALSSLESAKLEEEIDKCREIVQQSKEKSERSIMVLEILTKVNTELAFARAELDEALEKQEGDIIEARKRVMWLEDRMGLLCGKARIRGQAYQKPNNKTYRSQDRSTFRSRLGSGSDSEKSSEDGYQRPGDGIQRMGRNQSIGFKSDASRQREVFTPSDSGSDYQPYAAPTRSGLADSASSGADSYLMAQQQMSRGPGMMSGPGMDSDSESDDGMPPGLPPGLPQISGPVPHVQEPETDESDDDSEYEDSQQLTIEQPSQGYQELPSDYTESQKTYTESQKTFSVRYEDEIEYGPALAQDDEESEAQPVDIKTERETVDQAIDEEQERDIKEEEEKEEEVEGQEEKAEGIDREKSDASEKSESRGSSGSEASEKTSSGQQEKEAAFMTEVSFAKNVTIKTARREITRPGHRRVTFRDMSFSKDESREFPAMEATSSPSTDLARDYWHSEHHRFEYSQYSEVLCELDPLSYHSVGLAIPGTFIEKPEKGFEDLPWRTRRKGSDINDIHKIALDKLAGRVHTMYDKLYDAALISVRPTQAVEDTRRREATMMSSFDNSREGARSGTPTESRPGMITAPPTTADGGSRPQTVSTVIVPSKLRTGLNVYHPKPIPPPEVLPLTRTSKDKLYPKMADSFTEPDILDHKPAIRIVDQRNLYKETKLKLYRDKPKNKDLGASHMEKKFRLMLEAEKSMGSRSSRVSSRQTTSAVSSQSSAGKFRFDTPSSLVSKSQVSIMGRGLTGTRMSMTRTLTKAEKPDSEAGGDGPAFSDDDYGHVAQLVDDQSSTWSRLKPSSRGKEYSGLKWERVKTMVHVNLVSRRPEERRDAARHLGLLQCGDAMVFYALKDRLRIDEDARTRYEAAKALILLGCWDEDVLQTVLRYLVTGNTEIRQDLIRYMTEGKNVQYVNKKTPTFPELVKVLSHFCRNPDPDDVIAFDSAVLLGRLCVLDENARAKLLQSLEQSTDTHVKAKALEVLVRQLSCTHWEVVQHLLALFKESHVWKYRVLAADLLIVLGKENVCQPGEEERIYQILEKKLWDDPTPDVRVSAAKALTALGMFVKACDRIEKRLEDTDEDIRAQAVISVGTLEMKSEKIIRLLLEMLELDASEYVRLMIARTFANLKMTDKRVLRALRERDKVEGALARTQLREITKRIKESVKSSGVLGRITPPYIPYRPQVYGIPRYTKGTNSTLHSSSDRMRLLSLVGFQLK